jgi:hypothetical protein
MGKGQGTSDKEIVGKGHRVFIRQVCGTPLFKA